MKKNKLDGFVKMDGEYDNYYINNEGKIYSSKRDIFMEPTTKELYEQVQLYGNSVGKNFKVCDLTAKYFLQEIEGKKEVWFKDGDIHNNSANNLFYVNEKELRTYRNIYKAKILYQQNHKNKGYKLMESPFEIYCIDDKGDICNLALDTKLATPIYKDSYTVKLAGTDNSAKTEFVENLVAYYFLDKIDGKDKVWHNDRNKLNNDVNNLRWVTQREYSALEAGIEYPESKLFGFKQLDEPFSEYYISKKGEIYSLKRDMFMNFSKNGEYYCLSLRNKDNNKGFRVHDLVAKYFLDKVENKTVVWHINRDFLDNRVENLKYVDDNELIALRDQKKIDNYASDFIENGYRQLEQPNNNYCINEEGKVYSMTSKKYVSPEVKGNYYSIRLNGVNKKEDLWALHDLVGEMFVPKCKGAEMIWHKDRDKFNCHASNLEWITVAESYKRRAETNFIKEQKDGKLNGFIRMNTPYDDYYINNKGEIYSGHKKEIKNLYLDKDLGYHFIELSYGKSKTKVFSIKTLVAEYFLPKVDGKNKIWHKDGNELNCNVENLVWVSDEELIEYRMQRNKKIMENELKDFVEIVYHNGYYYINKEGKIYSFYINNYLKLSLTDEDGYYTVNLVQKDKIKRTKFYYVHRLVADHFIPKIENMPFVNHLDGNKQNNNVKNLEWTDHVGNALHAHATGLHPKHKNMNKFIIYQLDDNDDIVGTYRSISEINKKFNDGKWNQEFRETMNDDNNIYKYYGYFWKIIKINHDSHDDEIWKPANIKNNIHDFVVVSNYARVRNIITNHYYVAGTGKCNKYFKVSIQYGDKKYTCSLHRLVALSFLENNCGEDAHVDHKDKNPKNNNLSNLQWMTPKDHMKKDHGICVTQVCDNGDINVYDTLTEAAEIISCDHSQISQAIKKWTHFRNAYWYRTDEYDEDEHDRKIDELNSANIEKEEAKKIKKKKRNYQKENEKRKKKIKINKENLKKKESDSDSETSN